MEKVKLDTSEKAELDNLKKEMGTMVLQGGKREAFISQMVEENNLLQQRLDEADGRREEAEMRAGELQEYVGHMHEKMEMMQEELEELVRKTRSQEETLSDLVKNKLDM